MIGKLPFTLTAGVTATREGLLIDASETGSGLVRFFGSARRVVKSTIRQLTPYDYYTETAYLVLWRDAAKHLRYQEGQPWITLNSAGSEGEFYCVPANAEIEDKDIESGMLHRLAAIICDDAAAFRVLHWCATNLGGRYE